MVTRRPVPRTAAARRLVAVVAAVAVTVGGCERPAGEPTAAGASTTTTTTTSTSTTTPGSTGDGPDAQSIPTDGCRASFPAGATVHTIPSSNLMPDPERFAVMVAQPPPTAAGDRVTIGVDVRNVTDSPQRYCPTYGLVLYDVPTKYVLATVDTVLAAGSTASLVVEATVPWVTPGDYQLGIAGVGSMTTLSVLAPASGAGTTIP